MKPKREIYSIAYNKTVTQDGVVRASGYTLDEPSVYNNMRVPTEIVLQKIKGLDYVTVYFKDGYSHSIPFQGIELMYREVNG